MPAITEKIRPTMPNIGDLNQTTERVGDYRAGPLFRSIQAGLKQSGGIAGVLESGLAAAVQPNQPSIATQLPAGAKVQAMGYSGIKRVDIAGQPPLYTNTDPGQAVKNIAAMRSGDVSINGAPPVQADAMTSMANPDYALQQTNRRNAEALNQATARGDWDAVKSYYVSRGESFGGQTADEIKAEQAAQAAQAAADQRSARRASIAEMALNQVGSIATDLRGGHPMTRSQRNALEAVSGQYSGIAAAYGRDDQGMAPERVDAYRALAEQRRARADRSRAVMEGDSATKANRQRLSDLQDAIVNASTPEERDTAAQLLRQVQGKSDGSRNTLSLAQEARNAMIDGARTKLAGMTTKDMLAKTQKYTATGRENPNFDPELDRAYRLANTRKIGDDQAFDTFAAGQGEQQAAGKGDDVAARFASDNAMKGYRLGKTTDQGIEVYDQTGNLIGHYR